MKKKILFIAILVLSLTFSTALYAHFQALIPSKDIVSNKSSRQIDLSLIFTHPFNQQHMNMAKPDEFGVYINKSKTDLSSTVVNVKRNGFDTWNSSYTFKRPGDHIFYLVPAPYFEESEGKFLVHNTKVVVNAFGMENGWADEIGLDAEIIPLTRPYGLWTGNIFRGVVKRYGKVVPGAMVEIEYYNVNKKVKAPEDAFETQVVIADKNGVFSYAMPKAGWWGFSAVLNGKDKIAKNGTQYPVELGAIMWVQTTDMK